MSFSSPRSPLNSRLPGWVDILSLMSEVKGRLFNSLPKIIHTWYNRKDAPTWPPLSAGETRIWGLIPLSLGSAPLLSLSSLLPPQVFGFGRLLMGGTHRHKEMILWAFFWAHVQFLKIPFDPLRSRQPTLVNITQKLAAPSAVLGACLLKCQPAGNSVSFLELEAPWKCPANRIGRSDHWHVNLINIYICEKHFVPNKSLRNFIAISPPLDWVA